MDLVRRFGWTQVFGCARQGQSRNAIDLVAASLIDPVKVTRLAQQNGASNWGLMLTTNGKFLYGSNGSINTISGYSIGSDGRLNEIAGSPFSTSENFTIHDVEFDPSGNFLYAMDGHIVVFRVDAATGGLTEITGSPFSTGDVAIAAVIDPTGKFLYAANNHATVSAFSIDGTTGALNSLGATIPVGAGPSHITMDPSGKFYS